jgi:hypothetical protein
LSIGASITGLCIRKFEGKKGILNTLFLSCASLPFCFVAKQMHDCESKIVFGR